MIIFIVIGVIFAVVGVILMLVTHGKKVRCTSVTTATVVDIIRGVTRNHASRNVGNGANIRVGNVNIGVGNGTYNNTYNTTSFYPLFEYNVDGIKYVRKASTGSSSPKYGIGQQVEIHYNASNPNEFYDGKGNSSMIMGIIFTILGLLFIAIYLGMKLI